MVEVFVIAEGQTEEKFIKQLVAPSLRHLQVYVKPLLLNTSNNAKGGAVSFERLKFNVRNILRQNPNSILSTFLDLYALDPDFPAFDEAKGKATVYNRIQCLEAALHDSVVTSVACRPDRFLPHIQPYEFEGLLFSDVEALSAVEPRWSASLISLRKVRDSVETPEQINDGYDTKPSKRLEDLLIPKYKKTMHGPRAAERITLSVIEQECAHFNAWMNALRGLALRC